MKTIVIIGGGSGGVSTANHLAYKLKEVIKSGNVRILLVEGSKRHYYQPGFLEVPFGVMSEAETYRDENRMVVDGVQLIQENATHIDLKNHEVKTENQKIKYDYIVIATGARYDYDAVPGMKEATFNFYSLEESIKLKKALNEFKKGKIVVAVSSMPYKCTPAPLEAVFMLNDLFKSKNLRNDVSIEYVYPLPMAFPDKGISDIALKMFKEKNIKAALGFQVKSVNVGKKELVSKDSKKIPFDIAILVPPHRGSKLVADSKIGDAMDWIPTDKFTLNVVGFKDAYAIGDATNLPVSKAGSVADAEAIVVADRISKQVIGYEPDTIYDGSGGALMVTGLGTASMITSSYIQHPIFMPESYSYYWLKLIYNQVYWNMTAKAVLSGVMK